VYGRRGGKGGIAPGTAQKDLMSIIKKDPALSSAYDVLYNVNATPEDRQKAYNSLTSDARLAGVKFIVPDFKSKDLMDIVKSDPALAGAYKTLYDANASTTDKQTAYKTLTSDSRLAGAKFTPPSTGLSKSDEGIVNSILNYKYPAPTSGFALRSPYWQRIIGAVMEQDPLFDATQYNARYKLRQDFTSGKSANNIRSLNTVTQHLSKLEETGTALQNSNVPAANAAINWIKKNTGNPSVTNFAAAANAVSNELVTVFKNTGATDQEIENIRNTINENSTPAQIHGYINTALSLINGRINALKTMYESGMQKPLDFQMLDKNSKNVFTSHGVTPADIANNPQSDEDKQALEWARQNRNDPRAQRILQLNGEK
jgi:hypothetical protein